MPSWSDFLQKLSMVGLVAMIGLIILFISGVIPQYYFFWIILVGLFGLMSLIISSELVKETRTIYFQTNSDIMEHIEFLQEKWNVSQGQVLRKSIMYAYVIEHQKELKEELKDPQGVASQNQTSDD